jgi:hypothetical protein
MLRVGLKLTAVVLRRQRGSSIPNKRRPMDSTIFDILDAERSALRRRFAGLFHRSRGTAGHQAFRLHRAVGNIASEPNAHPPRKTAAALIVVVRARAVGRWALLKNQSENPDYQKPGRDKHERRTDRDGSASGYFVPVHRRSRPRRPDPRTAEGFAMTRPRHLHQVTSSGSNEYP